LSEVWRPTSPLDLPDALARWLTTTPGVVRVGIDGPAAAQPDSLAASMIEPLRALGRPAVHIPAATFWRDAALRLEFGHEDVEGFLSWLDADALRREVLLPLVERGEYLPSLRDPVTNRSTREPVRTAEPSTVLLVSGELLLGLGLPFDRVIHLAMSPAARARHTEPSLAWTLPAFENYDETVDPASLADVVIRLEDPRRPAVRGLP
jgi:hypothetical protein